MSKKLRYKGLSAATKHLLSTEGESGRFEFKREAGAIGTTVLVAAANTAAFEGLDHVTLLVGVGEQEDPNTGLVTGTVIGLEMPIERARNKITAWANATRPVPVHVTIIEENVGATKPILRLEVKATRAPHYDEAGRRVVRSGASTRALTDEEMLEMYLVREAESFRRSFEEIAGDMEKALDQVRGDIGLLGGEISDDLKEIHEIAQQAADDSSSAAYDAWSGKNEAEDTFARIARVENYLISRVPTSEQTHGGLFIKLASVRREAWKLFVALTEKKKTSKKIVEAQRLLEEVLDTTPIPEDYLRNFAEWQAWQKILDLKEVPSLAEWVPLAQRIHNKRFEQLGLTRLTREEALKEAIKDSENRRA